MKFLHVELRVRVNEDANAYKDPEGSETVSFSVPLDLFDAKKISNIFPQMIRIAEDKLDLAKVEEELNDEGE